MPGLPTETAPMTYAIDLRWEGVPAGLNCSTYSDMGFSAAIELVPMTMVPRGSFDLTSFLMTLSRTAEPCADLTFNLVRHCAMRAANVL